MQCFLTDLDEFSSHRAAAATIPQHNNQGSDIKNNFKLINKENLCQKAQFVFDVLDSEGTVMV